MVLGSGLRLLAACGGAGSAELEKAAAEARAKMNQYCDARQKAIEALSEAGAQ